MKVVSPLFHQQRLFFHVLLLLNVLSFGLAAIQEPWVKLVEGFFDVDDCNTIIREAEIFGFPETSDSIDYNDPKSSASRAIDVVLDGVIQEPSLAALYESYLPKLNSFVSEQKLFHGDTSEPTLDWVFLRKYEANSDRRMLKLHHDINLFTVNVALNDDYEGGGLFYHKNDDSWFEPGNPRPLFPEEKLTYKYLEHIQRQNTSELVFPNTPQGSLLIHNYTLYHAIAPIERGIRYSLIFFFDMHHPDVRHLHSPPFELTVESLFPFAIDIMILDMTSIQRHVIPIVENVLQTTISFTTTASQRCEVIHRQTGVTVQSFVAYNKEDDNFIQLSYDDNSGIPGRDPMLETKIRIFNLFTFPVSLVWIDLEDRPIPRVFVAEELYRKTDLQCETGHYFEVVEYGTDQVVDYFFVDEPDDDGEYIYHVGPIVKDPPDFVSLMIYNHLSVSVSLYFIDENEEEEGYSKVLIHENLPNVFRLKSTLYHRFEVISNDTGDVLHHWEVVEDSDRRMLVNLHDPYLEEDNSDNETSNNHSEHDHECSGTTDEEL